MSKKAETKAKRPFSVGESDQSCPNCGKGPLVFDKGPFEIEVRHDGRLHLIQVSDLEGHRCKACGKLVVNNSVDRQVNAALRTHLQLLTPEQIRSAIQQLGASQKDVASCLGIAEETLSRWLNDSQIQTRALDVLMRVFFGFPAVRTALGPERDVSELGLNLESCPPRHTSRHDSKSRTADPSSQSSNPWNGGRDLYRKAQECVQAAGSTWGRARCA